MLATKFGAGVTTGEFCELLSSACSTILNLAARAGETQSLIRNSEVCHHERLLLPSLNLLFEYSGETKSRDNASSVDAPSPSKAHHQTPNSGVTSGARGLLRWMNQRRITGYLNYADGKKDRPAKNSMSNIAAQLAKLNEHKKLREANEKGVVTDN